MEKAVPDRIDAPRRDGSETSEREPRVSLAAALAAEHGGTSDAGVEVVATPSAVRLFTADRVYKLARPIGIARDDRVSERRRLSCEEELRLNRRLSTGIYLGVVPVTRERDGRVVVQGQGAIVDWAVEMVRLPADRMLDRALERGRVARSELERIADDLARFHERAMTGPEINEHGLPSSIAAEVRASFRELRDLCARHPDVLDERELAFLEERSTGFVEENRELLERRVALWRIRDGHGALHADHVCLARGGVVVYDCEVDQERRTRFGDVARDLAMLVVDLDDLGHASAAEILVDAYTRAAPDDDLEHLVGFYRVQRALERVRALLAALDESDHLDAGARRDRARQLAHLALGYEAENGLVLVGGADAAARGPLARYLASRARAVLATGEPAALEGRAEPGDDAALGARPSFLRQQLEYRRLLDETLRALQTGRTVVVDAAFAEPSSIRAFVAAAARLDRPARVIAVGDGITDPGALRHAPGDPVERTARAVLDSLLA